MDWAAIGAIGEILGALAVMATLGYLAVQIRQNTRTTRYQTTQNLIAANSHANFMISENGELASILQRGCEDRDSLPSLDQIRFNAWYFAYYNHFDNAFHQYRMGQLEESIWQKMEYEMPLFISSLPGARAWWEEDKARMSQDFREWLDAKLAEGAPIDELPTFVRESRTD